MKITEDNMVQNQMGNSLSTHFISSTCVIVHRCHGFGDWPLLCNFVSIGVMMAA